MPVLNILQADLKTIITKVQKDDTLLKMELEKKEEQLKKKMNKRKPHVDMGIPAPQKGMESSARAGSIFDPDNFKGNIELFGYLNDVTHSMMRHPLKGDSISKSIKIKKGQKSKYGIDDFNILLP